MCYKTIEADVALGTVVHMIKICPEHGCFVGMVERDPEWYLWCLQQKCKTLYDGYMIDVTSRCNLKCKYCYYPCNGSDRLKEDIIAEASDRAYDAPFILTGGEPTLHPDLLEIIRRLKVMGETWLLTNGVKLLEDGLFDGLLDAGLRMDGMAAIALSFHKESGGKDRQVLELARERGVKIGSSFWVIDDVAQIDEAVETYREFKDVLCSMRIKAASPLWSTKETVAKIFVSDMLKYMKKFGATINAKENNKLSYANLIVEDMDIKLVSWYDKSNVDLNDINCPPYYRAKDGTVNNLVTTGLINEGLTR
jgi:organic radical activating enzyme